MLTNWCQYQHDQFRFPSYSHTSFIISHFTVFPGPFYFNILSVDAQSHTQFISSMPCCLIYGCLRPPGGTQLFFFQVGVCGPDFRNVGLGTDGLRTGELILASEKGAYALSELKISKFGGLWTENFQIWGLVSWKFPNLGAYELKFGGIWVKIEHVEAKFSKFSHKGLVNWLLLEMGPLRTTGEAWKGVFMAAHPHTPFLGQCPPGWDPLNKLLQGALH